MTSRRPGRRPRLGLALAVLIGGRAAMAGTQVAIAIVAPQTCPPELCQRISDQIEDLAGDIEWSCPSAIDEDEPFRPRVTTPGLQLWIDLSPGTEARLTMHDGGSDRFVVRRIPLPRGLDEIGREEIGQIVRSALLAVRGSPDATMTRAQARAEVAHWPQPRATAARGAPVTVRPTAIAGRRLALEVGAFATARALASQLPVVGEVGASIGVGGWGPIGGWVEAADQLSARYDGAPVGVSVRALAVRAGLEASRPLGDTFRGRLGAGGGVTRTAFTPRAADTAATAAPAGAFTYATARVLAGLRARLGRHAFAALTLFVDLVGADVHYDLGQPDGTTRRVLAPYRFQPGVALEVGWSR